MVIETGEGRLGMRTSARIELYDLAARKKSARPYSFPIEIGRQPEGPETIQLAAKYGKISRRHGRIERRNDQFVFVDTSSNGTLVSGKHINQAERVFQAGDAIEIENYRIRILGEPIVLKHTSSSLEELEEISTTIGDNVIIALHRGRIEIAHIEDRSDIKTENVLIELRVESNFIRAQIRNPNPSPSITINNHPIDGGETALKLFDVLQLEGNRFEVLDPSQRKIICGNSTCQLINSPPFENNCKWCGHHLAYGYTRVIEE